MLLDWLCLTETPRSLDLQTLKAISLEELRLKSLVSHCAALCGALGNKDEISHSSTFLTYTGVPVEALLSLEDPGFLLSRYVLQHRYNRRPESHS